MWKRDLEVNVRIMGLEKVLTSCFYFEDERRGHEPRNVHSLQKPEEANPRLTPTASRMPCEHPDFTPVKPFKSSDLTNVK